MKRFLLSSTLVFSLVATVYADIVFNTLGAGNTYDQNNANLVTGPSSSVGNTFESAARFIAAAGGTLAQIDLGLTIRNGAGGSVNVYLYGDDSGSPDNLSQILLGSATPTQPFGTTNNSIVSLIPASSVPVNSGTTYWLVLKPGSSITDDDWNRSLGTSGVQDVSTDDMTWVQANTTLAAFRITAVPEPSTTALPILTLVFLVIYRVFRFRPPGSAAKAIESFRRPNT
jgi:hypothetical protein